MSPLVENPARHLLDWLVGYGHLPARAARWFLTALIASTALFTIVPPTPLFHGALLLSSAAGAGANQERHGVANSPLPPQPQSTTTVSPAASRFP